MDIGTAFDPEAGKAIHGKPAAPGGTPERFGANLTLPFRAPAWLVPPHTMRHASTPTRPSQSAEDYLERIQELMEGKGYARVVDIASSLKVKQASVTSMVQKLADEGYINTDAQSGGVGGNGEAKVEFQVTDKSIDFLGFKTLKDLLGSLGRASFGAHDTRDLATGVESSGAAKPYKTITAMVADPAIDALWLTGPNQARIENVEEIVAAIRSGQRAGFPDSRATRKSSPALDTTSARSSVTRHHGAGNKAPLSRPFLRLLRRQTSFSPEFG